MFIAFIILSFLAGLSIFLIRKNLYTKVASLVFLAALLALGIYSWVHLDEFSSRFFKFDSAGVLLTFVLALLSIATFYHSRLYLLRHFFTPRQEATYYASLIMLIMAMCVAYFAENIALLWVSIEATTLFVSMLIYHERSKVALEASWKYLFVSSTGVAIAFIGILFLSITASGNSIPDLSMGYMLDISSKMNPLWLKMTFLLILAGFSAKMGLFPLHTVAVDAHTVAPPPISAFISTTLMNVGFLGIFRIYTIISKTEILQWAQNVLIIAGGISIFMAAIQLLKIRHYKRMFAFSSLEHMGIVALGLGVGGPGYYAAILHLVLHAFVKAGLFYQIGQVHRYFKSYWIKDTGNYFRLNPAGALSVILGVVSILAIPPSGLFVTEFLTFKAMILDQKIFLAILILIMLSVLLYSFAKHTFHLLYHVPEKNAAQKLVQPNPFETVSQYVLFGLAIYLGIHPPRFLTELINQTIAILN